MRSSREGREEAKRAIGLYKEGRTDEALALLRAVSELEADSAASRSVAANALYLLSVYAYQQKRYDTASSAAERFDAAYANDPSLKAQLAEALWVQSRCFAVAGDHVAEKEVLERLSSPTFAASNVERVRHTAARAAYVTAMRYRESGDCRTASEVWRQLYHALRKAPLQDEPTMAADVLAARLRCLMELDDLEGAAESGRDLAEEASRLLRQEGAAETTAKTLLHCAHLLSERGLDVEAGLLRSTVADGLASTPDESLRQLAIRARIEAAGSLARSGHLERAHAEFEAVLDSGPSAVGVLDDVAARARRSDSPISALELAWALLMQASLLKDLGRVEEARARLKDVLHHAATAEGAIWRVIEREATAELTRFTENR